jgi:hypothetical protein
MEQACPTASAAHFPAWRPVDPVEHASLAAPSPQPIMPSWVRAAAVAGVVTVATAVLAAGIGVLAPGGGRDRTATMTPASSTAAATPTSAAAQAADTEAGAATPDAPTSGPGYRIVSTDGGVFTHGWASFEGSAAGASTSPTVGIAQADDAEGYWVASADGGVFAFGAAPFHGSAVDQSATSIVDIASAPTGDGYWLAASDGGVFAFGDAGYFGSGPELGLTTKAVSIARTATGAGYWLVSGDGGVFAFGDAPFFGSLGDQSVNARIIDLVPTASGGGYYLVAADGGIFTFGDAVFFGSATGEKLSKPIVDMALAPGGSGYWLLSGDGGVYTYGGAPFLGAPISSQAGGRFTAIAAGIGHEPPPPPPPPAPEAAPAAAPIAPEPPAVAPAAAAQPGVRAASNATKKGAATKDARKERQLDHQFGWDISYPQCDGAFPEGDFAFSVVGVNGGRAFKYNRCLGEQWRWARAHGAAGIYVNVHFPRSPEELAKGATSDRQPDCAPGALACVAYNFGLNGVRDSLAYARAQGVDAPFVWLDVEQLNYWYPDPAFNAVVMRGAVDAAAEAGMGVGVYSTPYQYKKITGDEQLGVPVWSAGAADLGAFQTYCRERGFGGGPAVMVQFLPGQFDPNLACPGAGAMSQYFRMP